MSYDLTIARDETFSVSTLFSDLADFLRAIEHVKPNGDRGFVFEPSTNLRMEIDLEVVNDEGDNIEEDGREYPEINCVRLHIPYFDARQSSRSGLFSLGARDRGAAWLDRLRRSEWRTHFATPDRARSHEH